MKKTKKEVLKTNYIFQKENQVFLLDNENSLTKTYEPVSFNWTPSKSFNKINIWFIFVIFLGITLFTSCSDDDQLIGSQRLVSEIREVAEFTKLKSTGVFDVNIVQGDIQSVEITADDNIIGRVRTNVVNGELRLELLSDIYGDITLRANITVRQLDRITNSGVGDIVANNITTDQDFSISNSGEADIRISGTASSLSCFNEGSGDIIAFDFLVIDADLEIKGTGSIKTSCAETLEAKISGSGDILYRGNPSINASISGTGEVINVTD
nr:head GIN domain-containing protein [uncultured Allomuricauda sp.]